MASKSPPQGLSFPTTYFVLLLLVGGVFSGGSHRSYFVSSGHLAKWIRGRKVQWLLRERKSWPPSFPGRAKLGPKFHWHSPAPLLEEAGDGDAFGCHFLPGDWNFPLSLSGGHQFEAGCWSLAWAGALRRAFSQAPLTRRAVLMSHLGRQRSVWCPPRASQGTLWTPLGPCTQQSCRVSNSSTLGPPMGGWRWVGLMHGQQSGGAGQQPTGTERPNSSQTLLD